MVTSWRDLEFFTGGTYKDVLKRVSDDVKRGYKVLPAPKNIFNAFKFTPYNKVKVVILGQDPYPDPKYAHGLAFSVPKGVRPLPASLRNIFKELEADLGIVRTHGNLEGWARQGVLLLNAFLTVRAGNPSSHRNVGWDALTKEVIEVLNSEKSNLVFILWGKFAQGIAKDVDTSKHLVIKSSHPSPLGARYGFFGSRPFSRTNTYLTEHGKDPIKWEV